MPVVQLQVAEVSTIEEENTREDNSIEELEFRGDTHADIILDGLNKLRSQVLINKNQYKINNTYIETHKTVEEVKATVRLKQIGGNSEMDQLYTTSQVLIQFLFPTNLLIILKILE